MKCTVALALLMGTTACGEVGEQPLDASGDDKLLCDASKTFGQPLKVEVPSPAAFIQSISLLSDERTAYVSIGDRIDGNFDLYRVKRSSKDVAFTDLEKLAISAGESEPHVAVSRDGALLVFTRSAPGPLDLYESVAEASGAFTSAKLIAPLSNTDVDLGYPYLLGGANKTLYFTQYGQGQDDIYVAARSNNAFLTPVAQTSLYSSTQDVAPVVTIDGREMVFSHDGKLHLATRANDSAPFTHAELQDSNGAPIFGASNWISDDGCRLYYSNQTYNADDAPIASAIYMRSRQ